MDEVWEVVVADLYDRGNPSNGASERTLVQGPEGEARRVFADRVADASEHGHQYVKLRCNGKDVESWPQATGWTV
ncbi:hypothetical protein NIIDNTM18_53850 [Mycolicibacterium litorale]|uniref:Uncharacterized protein n=1 Tax=Mycolicibacterium litorale TaxID=758802 RepID=A0A6S6PEI4_9MYCO|nr:hypothetical protein [Mycolicibacterium litorale]BCI56107.1 hypothetical protein NIIDNTM18_53850 [Mycolicibacterium litorale]